ncbi:NAD(P)-binding protein [Delitschia confertaspora ATCC 74209]|uniref:NAD(P)-binding protein n=1 Tax=Delitschia confertaspora ATCC 74209 TaxID=1513339 RepID=A0A9P4MZR1_9PLEO|nr:NAD(P)-binding protein [Delitschia confertaspora ATCC 74209]
MSSIRHALITGGSRGIGLSIAHHLARNSYRITLISRTRSALETAVSSLPLISPENAFGRAANLNHAYIEGDVSLSQFWENLNSETGDGGVEKGTVDLLVNCAGISQNSLLVRTQPSVIENVVATNLTSVMLAVRALIKAKKFRSKDAGIGSPSVINLASLLAIKGGRGAVAYSASKAGVLGLTRALAAECGPMGLRVNAIVPGYVETDMTKGFSPAAREEITKHIPLKRFGTCDEIAQAALFLATNEYANNCVINLDGGLSAI